MAPKRQHRYWIALLFFLVLAACNNYYKATSTQASGRNIDSLQLLNRTFILRNGGDAYLMKSLKLSEDQKILHAILDTLPQDHQLHLTRGVNNNLRYKKNIPNHAHVLSEVHFYTAPNTIAALGTYTLPLDSIRKIEIIEKDKGRTTSSYVLGGLAITAGTLALAAIIIAATKSSCPFVSAYDSSGFSLQGEIYGGAIYPQLTRHDYLPLRMTPTAAGNLQVKISNELKEKQFTDLAELWVISHKNNIRVLADAEGNLYSVAPPEKPVSASLASHQDVLKAVLEPDDLQLLYFDDTTSKDGTNELFLNFRKPGNQKAGKLVLTLKNSYWLDYLYGELAKGFGSYYATYVKKQVKKPAAELMQWVKDQKIPLEIFVQTKGGWKKVSEVNTIGPLATREVVIPLTLDEIGGEDIQLKLSSGFMFWEIDAAGMDYSSSNDFNVTKLNPSVAVDEAGTDVREVLQSEDDHFLEQPVIGNVATLSFVAPAAAPGMQRSYIFHTRGYYQHIRDFRGKPDIKFLKQFTNANAFPLFGMNRYKKLNETKERFLAIK